MRFFTLVFIFLGSLDISAQSSMEFTVHFDKDCFIGGNATSRKFEVAIPEDAPFTGLSAYILKPDLKVTLSYRLKQDRNWTEWHTMEENHEGETPGRTTFKAPVIEQAFSEIQFRSNDSLDSEVIFRLYFPASSEKKSPEQTFEVTADSSCNCVQPAICGRNCWCPSGNCPKDTAPDHTFPTHIIVHHSAGGNNTTDYAALVSFYWDYHVNTNGWSDIGYNWLIDPNGVVYEGRGDSVLGAHFSCMNSGTTGICLIGNFEGTNPASQALSSLSYLIAWESCDKGIVPWASSLHPGSQLVLHHISGHRDGNTSPAPNGCPKGTLCPGANLYAALPSIRADVSNNPCLGYLHSEEESFALFEVYPNPAHDFLKIGTTESLRKIEVINSSGQLVKTAGYTHEIPLENLPDGLYLVKGYFEEDLKIRRVLIH